MKFRFEANQQCQLDAIASVTDLFERQPRLEADIAFSERGGLAAVPNRLDIGEDWILANLQDIQRRNRLTPDPSLQYIEEDIDTGAGRAGPGFRTSPWRWRRARARPTCISGRCWSCINATGCASLWLSVPSVAVREGVLKTLRMTELHLSLLYGGMPYGYYVYDSSDLSQVRQFALSDSVEIMVMTIDSFNKASNVINQSTDRLQGETPIHLIQISRPVLVLDEPQNMESELRVRALSALHPLFALRYSATHRNTYNLVYRLTPFDAYRQGLVKRIEVASVVKEDDAGSAFVRLEDVRSRGSTLTAKVAAHRFMADGSVKEKTLTLTPGDSLEKKTERREYKGFEVDEISAGGKYIRFAHGVEIAVGEATGADKEAIFEAQIRYTIEEHFRKQRRLRRQGVKVLSLFFIDRVDNYAAQDGLIRRLFARAFDDIKVRYQEWAGREAEEAQAAYSASTRKKGGEVVYEDSRTGTARKDIAAYELIMENKERLLSFEEPVSFIFSHSALREGWDNPNVTQICTLNQSVSEMKKRQEVGRGVRLVVDQNGSRVRDERANVLTVIANESYERYVAQLQSEIETEYGRDSPPPPPPRTQKKTAKLRKDHMSSPEFRELWDRISQKTRYTVGIDADRLINDVVAGLDAARIEAPHLSISRARVAVGEKVSEEEGFEARRMSATRTAAALAGRTLPNLLDLITDLMENAPPPMRVTRRTLLEIYRRTGNKAAALDNPHGFASAVVRIIKDKMTDQLVEGIRYEKTNDRYEMSQFEEEIQEWEQYMVPAERSIYDHVILDSDAERKFVKEFEKWEAVRLYMKLPWWFTVPTPMGNTTQIGPWLSKIAVNTETPKEIPSSTWSARPEVQSCSTSQEPVNNEKYCVENGTSKARWTVWRTDSR